MTDSVKLSVLMVAEKPSIAETLATVLSEGKAKKRRGVGSVPVFEYDGTFLNYEAMFRVTATTGHVFSLNFGKEYENWDKHPPRDLFTADTVNTYDGRSNIPAHLNKEAEGCNVLCLWLDCDREGENICFEVMSQTLHKMDIKYELPGAYRQCVYRAQFSSLVATDIKQAMDSLSVPNENLSNSVDARQELDLRIGIAFSRLQTQFFRKHFGKQLGKPMVTYGPCQTPTLWFCVHRHNQIELFVPKPYWVPRAVISVNGDPVSFCSKSFDSPPQPPPATTAIVKKVKTWGSTIQRPLPLNTVELLRKASSILGIDPGSALHYAEQLYLKGITSYPRTETNLYAANFDVSGTVDLLTTGGTPWAGGNQSRNGQREDGTDAGDHPPVTPVKLATEAQCGPAWPIYQLIVENFLRSIATDATFEETEVTLTISGMDYKVQCSKLLEKGWTEIGTCYDLTDDGPLGIRTLKEGDELNVLDLVSDQHFTKPPNHLTESDLLTLMEEHGIGTDASMATHVSNVVKRNYVTLEGARELVPTHLGKALIHSLQLIDQRLCLPSIRSGIESECGKVASGIQTKEEVVSSAVQLFMNQFDTYESRIYYLPLMLAVALKEESGSTIEEGSKAKLLWDTAVRKTAEVDLGTLLALKDTPLSEFSATPNDDSEGHNTEHWITNVQTILEEMGFGPPNPAPVAAKVPQQASTAGEPGAANPNKKKKKKKKKKNPADASAPSQPPPPQTGGFQGFGTSTSSANGPGGLDWGAFRR
eukprot:TRINITY_DN4237_c0_g2_i1.p1 TRINITY_DN4237_c0_g2~~TRINITY_DN4237_c0_g2_i1.p1  ORF type:complete len:760 (+),score=136.87 TRINITY_DN4237_c0_g2_i1:79-2358(+)